MMKKILSEQINRQIQLMKYKMGNLPILNEAGPGPVSDWGAQVFKKLITRGGTRAESEFSTLFGKLKNTEAFQALESRGIRTMQDFVSDLKKINTLGPNGVLHKALNEEYVAMTREMLKTIFREPQYKTLADDIVEEYKLKIDPADLPEFKNLENLAKAGDIQGFNALKASVQSTNPPTFDVEVLKYLELKFPSKPVKTNVVPTSLDWFKGLWKSLGPDNVIVSIFKKFQKGGSDHYDLQLYFSQYLNIVRQFSEDLRKGITVNYSSYTRELDEIALKISKGEEETIAKLWKETREYFPDEIKKRFENPDGSLSAGNFKAWVKYFDDIESSGKPILPPPSFVSRLEAMKRWLLNPPDPVTGSKIGYWNNFTQRTFQFLKRGTFRLPAEKSLNAKIMGSTKYAGYTVGELLSSYFLVMPITVSFLKMWGDLLDRNYDLPYFLDDLFDAENFEGGEERTPGFGDYWNAFTTNLVNRWSFFMGDATSEQKRATFAKQFAGAYSPGLELGIRILTEVFKGGGRKKETSREIQEAIKRIEVDSTQIRDTLINQNLGDVIDDTTNNQIRLNLDSLVNTLDTN